MLLVQHIMLSKLVYDDNKFEYLLSSVVIPDAIRAYTKNRELSHFEESSDHDNDISWLKFPKYLSLIDEEFMKFYLSDNGNNHYLSRGIRKCAVGENSNIETFYEHNKHLDNRVFKGVETHLKQDITFDEFIRNKIDCSKRYINEYSIDDEKVNGEVARKLINFISNYHIYYLAYRLYKDKNIIANQNWLDDYILPIIQNDYSKDLFDKTSKFITMPLKYNDLITNKDWAELKENNQYAECEEFYNSVIEILNNNS